MKEVIKVFSWQERQKRSIVDDRVICLISNILIEVQYIISGHGSNKAGGGGEASTERDCEVGSAARTEEAQAARDGGDGDAVEGRAQVADEEGRWQQWRCFKGQTPVRTTESQQQSPASGSSPRAAAKPAVDEKQLTRQARC